jgi:multiple sugar transport system substrate-binding protein
MLASKAISPQGVFDSGTATSVGPMLAMTPGATWYGNYLFRDTFKIPAGQMAAAAPLTWPGESPATGDEGGGLWVMSKHISGATQTNALKVLNFMTTDPSWQVKLSTGFPAYGPVQQAWLDQQVAEGYFADAQNLSKIFIDAGTIVDPSYTPVLYSTGDIWTQVVTPGLVKGQSVSANWDAFQAQLVAQAKTFSYTVQTN